MRKNKETIKKRMDFKIDLSFLEYELYEKAIDIIKKNNRKSCFQFHILAKKTISKEHDKIIELNPILDKMNKDIFYFLIKQNGILMIKPEIYIKNFFNAHSSNPRKVIVIDPQYYVLTFVIFLKLISDRKKIKNENKIHSFSNSCENFDEKINWGYNGNYDDYKKILDQKNEHYNFCLFIDIKNFYPSITRKDIYDSIVYFHEIDFNIVNTIINLSYFINKEKDYILPICNENHLFSYIGNHVFLKRILVEFYDFVDKKYSIKDFFIIHWLDDINFFCNDYNFLQSIYQEFKHFLSKNFPNIEINKEKVTIQKTCGKSSYINSIDSYEKNGKKNSYNYVINKIQSLINFAKNSNFKESIDLLDAFTNQEENFHFQNLIYSVSETIGNKKNMSNENKEKIFDYLNTLTIEEIETFLKLNPKKVIEFLSQIDINKDKWGLKLIWKYIDYNEKNVIEYVQYEDLILFYSLNKSFKKIDSLLKEKKLDYNNSKISNIKYLIDFYSYCYKENLIFLEIIEKLETLNDKEEWNFIFKMVGNYFFYFYKKQNILAISQIGSFTEYIRDVYLDKKQLKKIKNEDIYKLFETETAKKRNNFIEIHPQSNSELSTKQKDQELLDFFKNVNDKILFFILEIINLKIK